MRKEKWNTRDMEKENQLPLVSDIPMDNPDALLKKKKKRYTNCIGEILMELIEERKLSLAKVHRDTEIPFPTLDDWAKSKSVPLTDENLMVLKNYFGVNIEYLCYGVGLPVTFDIAIERLSKKLKLSNEYITAIMEDTIESREESNIA